MPPLAGPASLSIDRLEPARSWRPRYGLLVAVGAIVLWVAWAASLNTGQFGDNVEQFNWAQSLELGYHKHPPLPSWLLGGLVHLFGPSIYWAYILAALCLTGTAVFMYLLGCRLFDARIASAGALLWGLNLAASQRAQLFNHNTVLVLFIAATALSAWHAQHDRSFRTLRWVLTGVLAAGAVLSKYQALVPLAGLLSALLITGRNRSFADTRGVLIALVTMTVCCAPHAFWVVGHDYTTLQYASESMADAGWLRRSGFLGSFGANQLRLWLPALGAASGCWIWNRCRTLRPGQSPALEQERIDDGLVWLAGLLLFPVIALVLMALVFGVSLRNHWGVQSLQFLGLGLAFYWRDRPWMDLKRLAVVAAIVHVALLTGYAVEHRDPLSVLSNRRNDTMYPARRMATAAVAHWKEETGCPLHFVAGTAFDAGLVSLYSGGQLQVFDNAAATPWITSSQLRRQGALYVLDPSDAIPPGLADVISYDIVPPDEGGRPRKTIRIGILRPEVPCRAP